MELKLEEQIRLTEIVTSSAGDIQKAVLAAYEEGILTGGLRAAQRLGAEMLSAQGSASGSNTSGDEDEGAPDSPLTPADRANLTRLGINPDLKFRQKNSTFQVVGYKPSRYKYPISTINQNGRRHKWPVDAVKRLQATNGVR